jgi:PAS domain S-box-containing protein
MIKNKNNFNILVIEDNPGDLLLIEDYLDEQIANPVIVHAGTFRECSSILSGDSNNFDVILLDLSLPDKSGEYLVTEILKFGADCPVIILTGFSDVDFSINSIASGIADYLLKDDLNATSLYKSIIYCIERRKQLQELKDSEKRYSNLFHLSPQPMWVYDPQTARFVQANKAAIEHYGYNESEFLAMPAENLWATEGTLQVKNPAKPAEPAEENFKGRYRHVKKSGELINVDIYSTPVMINDKIYWSVIAIDITEKILFEYKITRAIIKTQEDERYEIGAELHDNVCQILVSSLMNLGMIKDSIDTTYFDLVTKTREYVLLATSEIRNLSHRLAPVFFNESTLEEAFETLLQSYNIEKKIKLTIHFDPAVKIAVIDRELQLNLYRILQEQLNNIFKYAKAEKIDVNVVLHNNKLKMQVSDNGIGFNIDKVKKGIGLSNMKRRAELFLGTLVVNSSEDNGCEIIVEIPFQETNLVSQGQPEMRSKSTEII